MQNNLDDLLSDFVLAALEFSRSDRSTHTPPDYNDKRCTLNNTAIALERGLVQQVLDAWTSAHKLPGQIPPPPLSAIPPGKIPRGGIDVEVRS
ncbi:MAG: hypothetical protein EKK62_09485 [Acidimicrobiia bacterium]|nr:MAG: hypothetical protein EKK62_09485 [Acidimicrobiia bacterium]